MEKHFSLATIENKLQSLMRFSGSSGVVFKSGGQIYACPEELYENIGTLLESSGGEISLTNLLEHRTNVKTIPLPKGNLILIDPSKPLEEYTLEFLGEQLHGEVELFTIFDSILEANMAISSNLNLKTLLNIVMSLSEEILNTEVSAVMLLSPDNKELYWEISRGEGSEYFEEKVRLPIGEGIGGYVARTGESILSNDVGGDPRWCSSYDEKSGFRTRSMICVPVKYHGEILGVIEVINKRTGEFTARDLRVLEILAAQTGGAIENARIHGKLEEAYEELKTLDKAKERVINHLSHELKTPLALISSALEIISRNIKKSNITKLEKPIRRGKRNLRRLLELQEKIDDIVNQRSVKEGDSIIRIIEDAASFVEEISQESRGKNAEVLELVSKRIRSLFSVEEIRMEKIGLDEFLNNLCDETILSAPGRELKIIRNVENKIVLSMDRNILRKVCSGLLKNAIENTPDGGEIEINTKSADNEIWIDFHDRGVGIALQNQKMIFEGFFHTQDTNLYSSKRPYEFNAGGSGSDLLRTKIFSERYGFSVDFDSTRCKFIPEDSDTCPGKISSCHFIKEKSECFSSGSSTFSIKFPIRSNPNTIT